MSDLFVTPGVAPSSYDIVVAAGIASPGAAKISTSEIAREFVWDRKQAPGAAGENVTFRGIKLVEFTIEVQLWTDQHLLDWESWASLWDWDPVKKKATPVEVLHPLLAERGVFSASAMKIWAPRQVRLGDNLWIGKIQALEYKPPAKKNTTSSPTSSQGSRPAQPTAADKRDQQIAGLLALAKGA